MLLAFALTLSLPTQADDSEKGAIAAFDVSKKISKKFKLGGEVELRTNDYLQRVERVTIGIDGQYKIAKHLKANAGITFIAVNKPWETKIKTDDPFYAFDEEYNQIETPLYDYNTDHGYWSKRTRYYLSLTGEYKTGRLQLSLRERVQYTHTYGKINYEDKYRWSDQLDPQLNKTTNLEKKKSKDKIYLRSRLMAKYNIPKCKIDPFASVELYTRLDSWRGADKLRSRVGASYKIDKKNQLNIYYQFDKVCTGNDRYSHSIGIGYSLDL